jgi:ABC-2 type transport system permease protein
MKGAIAVLRKELAVYFSSPIYYASTFMFLLISGYFFYSNTAYFSMLSLQATSNPFLSERLNVTDMVIRPFFGDLGIILLLMLPLISMRVYSEEKKTGTIELLFTYPISDGAALGGKYGAALILLLTMLAGTLPCMITLEVIATLDWGIVLSGYLGIALMGAGFIALGVFTSSLTENQIVAAVISFGSLLLFWLMGWAGSITGPPLNRVLEHLSIVSHLDPFIKGLIDTRDVIFYLLFSSFWIFLTLRFLNSRFWRG